MKGALAWGLSSIAFTEGMAAIAEFLHWKSKYNSEQTELKALRAQNESFHKAIEMMNENKSPAPYNESLAMSSNLKSAGPDESSKNKSFDKLLENMAKSSSSIEENGPFVPKNDISGSPELRAFSSNLKPAADEPSGVSREPLEIFNDVDKEIGSDAIRSMDF